MSHQKSPAIASNPCGRKQHQSRISGNLEHIKHNLRSDLPIRLNWLTFKLNTSWIKIHKNTSQLPTVGRSTSCRPIPPKQACKGRANPSQKHPSVDESNDRKATSSEWNDQYFRGLRQRRRMSSWSSPRCKMWPGRLAQNVNLQRAFRQVSSR